MNIEQLQTFCISLPAVVEEIKWGNNLVFSVGGKIFCIANLEPPFTCSFKVKEEEFEEMSNRTGLRPAPYLARAKWIFVAEGTQLTQKEWAHYLKQSYELVKSKLPKKVKAELGLESKP